MSFCTLLSAFSPWLSPLQQIPSLKSASGRASSFQSSIWPSPGLDVHSELYLALRAGTASRLCHGNPPPTPEGFSHRLLIASVRDRIRRFNRQALSRRARSEKHCEHCSASHAIPHLLNPLHRSSQTITLGYFANLHDLPHDRVTTAQTCLFMRCRFWAFVGCEHIACRAAGWAAAPFSSSKPLSLPAYHRSRLL